MDVKIAVELNTGPSTGKLEFPLGLPVGSSLDLILHRSATSAEASEKDFILSYAYVNGKRVPVARRQRNAGISRAITVQTPTVNGQAACVLKPCPNNNGHPKTGALQLNKPVQRKLVPRESPTDGVSNTTPAEDSKVLPVTGNGSTEHVVKTCKKAPIIDKVTAAKRQRTSDAKNNQTGEQEQPSSIAGKSDVILRGPRCIFKCVECQEEFNDEQSLEAHATRDETASIQSSGERYAYICSKCYNQAPTKQESVKHWEEHFGKTKSGEENDERSVDIIVVFRQGADVARCKKTVTAPSQGSKNCDIANESRRHVAHVHSVSSNGETCNAKQEALSTDGARDPSDKEVVVRVVEYEPRQICEKCDVCGKVCSSKQRLESHRWTHTADKPYKCDVCSATFVNESFLVTHSYTHSGDWPYKCSRCPRGFVRHCKLTAHMKRSHEIAYFACPICFNVYLHEVNLNQHMVKKHRESAPYRCTVCKRAFFKKDVCTRHESRCEERRDDVKLADVRHCTYCSAVFSTYQELRDHVAIHPEAIVFECEVCGKISLHSGMHQKHLLSHGEKKERPTYSCSYCDRSFKSRKGMQAHVNFHTNTRPHGCDKCGASLSSASNLKAHMVSIHGEPGDDAKCPHCPKVFKLKRSLNIHINTTHRQKLEHQCELCSKKLASEKKLQKHIALVHTNDAEGVGDANRFPLLKLLQCRQCPFRTFSYTRMVRHRVGHSGIYPHQCSECSRQFVFKDQLTRHVRTVHRKGRLACPHCPRLFLADRLYRQHVEMHRSEQGHACSVCGRYYESEAGLEHHSQCHSQNLPFECEVCKKRFRFSQGLLVHRRFHHEDPSVGDHTWPHSCSACRTRFKYHSSLAAHHLNKHSDCPKPTCGYCGKTFNSPCVLSLHIRTHTGEKPHVCEHCGKAFRISTNLKNHVITQHTKEFKMFCPLCGKGVVSNVKLKQHLVQLHKAVGGRKGTRAERVVEEQMLDITAPLAYPIVENPEALLLHMTV